MALDLSAGIIGLTDENVKITATDSTAGHLLGKVTSSDASVTFTTVGAAGTDQTLDIKAVAGGGEVNTGSNVGGGTGNVFKQKSGVDLQFKTLIGGTNVTVTDNASDITIDASGGAADGNGIFDVANTAGGGTVPSGFEAQMTSGIIYKTNTAGGGVKMLSLQKSDATETFFILSNGNATFDAGADSFITLSASTGLITAQSDGTAGQIFSGKRSTGVESVTLLANGHLTLDAGVVSKIDLDASTGVFRIDGASGSTELWRGFNHLGTQTSKIIANGQSQWFANMTIGELAVGTARLTVKGTGSGVSSNTEYKNSAGTITKTIRNNGTTIYNGFATETLDVLDSGSATATQQDWIEVEVGGNTGYIHVFAAK